MVLLVTLDTLRSLVAGLTLRSLFTGETDLLSVVGVTERSEVTVVDCGLIRLFVAGVRLRSLETCESV